jgi:hypothetical protein
MLSRYAPALAAMLGSAFLWAVALQELARQPVTNTGTQPTTHPVDR